MNVNHKMKARDAKANPITALFVSVFAMFLISGLFLLLLALLLYKMQLTESAVKLGIIVIYVVAGIAGGFLAGKIQKEQKYLWGLVAGLAYFALLFAMSAVLKGGFELDMTKVLTTMALCGASGMIGGMIS